MKLRTCRVHGAPFPVESGCRRCMPATAPPPARPAGPEVDRPAPTIAIVGPIAAGKSTIADRLVELTGWPALSIDAYRDGGLGWLELVADLRRAPAAIVESVAMPEPYRAVLHRRRALIVRVVVDERERQRRIAGLCVPRRPFVAPAAVDATVRGDQSPEPAVLVELIERARARAPDALDRAP